MLKLARDLNVDLDLTRRHHVCELYSSGLDKLAEEVNFKFQTLTMISMKLFVGATCMCRITAQGACHLSLHVRRSS